MRPFDYSYTPGTGSELIGAPLSRVVAANFTAVEEAAPIAAGSVSLAKGALNPALTEELALTANSLTNEGLPSAEATRDYLATVTFIPPASAGSLVYELYVAPGNSEAVPGNADTVLGGTFEFFGMRGAKHSHHADPLHITYNITDAVQALNGHRACWRRIQNCPSPWSHNPMRSAGWKRRPRPHKCVMVSCWGSVSPPSKGHETVPTLPKRGRLGGCACPCFGGYPYHWRALLPSPPPRLWLIR